MKSIHKILKIVFVATVLAMFTASPAFACAACGSANSDMPASPLTNGMNLGILTLFGVIATVLGTIASFFVYIIRKETAATKAEAENFSEVKV
jgi:hypothetical protein